MSHKVPLKNGQSPPKPPKKEHTVEQKDQMKIVFRSYLVKRVVLAASLHRVFWSLANSSTTLSKFAGSTRPGDQFHDSSISSAVEEELIE